MISTKVGNFPVFQCTKYGEEVQGPTLKEMTLTPAANLIIFSLAKRQKEYWKIHGDDNSICLTKGSRKVVFDIVINNPRGVLLCKYFKKNIKKVTSSLDYTKPRISIQLAHDILGHMDIHDQVK